MNEEHADVYISPVPVEMPPYPPQIRRWKTISVDELTASIALVIVGERAFVELFARGFARCPFRGRDRLRGHFSREATALSQCGAQKIAW
ncbi:MAG TPA: hypothetical protein VGC79_05980, partial [Polyangiaceae bacterium]